MTTSVDSTSNSGTPPVVEASKGSIGSSILLTLGSGSGINVQELATNLTNAEKMPAQYALQGKIDKTEAKISGYGLISSQLSILASSFEKINDANEIYSTTGKSSNDNAVSFLNITNDTPQGGYDVDVYQLAENQRIKSNSYSTSNEAVNSGGAFDITISAGTTRKGTQDHAITTQQLNQVGNNPLAFIEYAVGPNTIQISQAGIDTAMESIEGEGTYTFGNATMEGLLVAINNAIAIDATFVGNFESAQIHKTKGISFVETLVGSGVSLSIPQASQDGSTAYALGSVSQGIVSVQPQFGSSASHTYAPNSLGTDSLVVSDGTTTVTIPPTDFTDRTDYELAITLSEFQAAMAGGETISVQGSTSAGGSETIAVNLSDMLIFGLPIPAGAVSLNDLANALNAKASPSFEMTAVVNDNKLTFVQETNGTGNISGATTSSGGTVGTTAVVVSSVQQMAEAIQESGSYENLKFTVSATTTDLQFDYKTDGVASAPTFTLNDSAQTATSSTAGVNAINAAVNTTIKIGAGSDTLAGIVAAINNADTGVTASLLDAGGKGNDYRIVLSGLEGIDGSFTVATDSTAATSSLGFNDAENELQAAKDAEIGFEGLLIRRSTNVISDVIAGASFQINSVTGTQSSVAYSVLQNDGLSFVTKYRNETKYDSERLTVTQDKSQLKTNLQEIISGYNDLGALIAELQSDEAVDAELSLSGESSVLRAVQGRIYNALTAASSTVSGSVDAIRDLGISVDRFGKLEFNETKYDSITSSNWDDVVNMLTAGTSNQSLFSAAPAGLSQDVATIINDLKASTIDGDAVNGLIANRTAALTKSESNYEVELSKLEERMTVLYQRYLNQFTAMETLMNSLNNTRDYMKGQLDVITSAYDKN
jgi:flagellar hook-associated protein 2